MLEQLRWLESRPDTDVLLDDVPATRMKHLSEMAAVMDAGGRDEASDDRKASETGRRVRELLDSKN